MANDLITNSAADLSDHLFVIQAAVILGDARKLYQEAWRLRRLMYRHAGASFKTYEHYYGKFQNIRTISSTGEKCVKQIESIAYQVLGTF